MKACVNKGCTHWRQAIGDCCLRHHPRIEECECRNDISEKPGGTMNEQIIAMVRNFPRHVGDCNPHLPEHVCGDEKGDEHTAFRNGWLHAVTTINNRITEMQSKAASDPQAVQDIIRELTAHTGSTTALLSNILRYWSSEKMRAFAWNIKDRCRTRAYEPSPLCKCADYTAKQRGQEGSDE